ncbi:MAG: iron-sulfur cluster repair di-iron protein [Nitrospinaceae bacterium]
MTTASFNIHTPINEFVKQDMRRAALFEELGIDSCCGGYKSLEEACAEKGLDPEEILARLIPGQKEEAPRQKEVTDWTEASLTDLVDHIEQTHHNYLKNVLPELTAAIEKVTGVHGKKHPELRNLQNAFTQLRNDLEPHMMKEEKVLFPMIRNLESGFGPGDSHCGGLHNPIRVMQMEHERANHLLQEIRELTDEYSLPEGGCGSYRAMLDKLKELDSDLQSHIHKENDILFPRAASME